MSATRGMRLLATVVFLGLPLAAAGATAWNFARAAELGAAAAARADELAPLTARLARTAPPAADPTGAVWLGGDNDALAAAALQARLVDLVSSASGRPIEVQALPHEDEAPSGDILMRITYDADNATLVATLLAVESGLPLLDVAELSVAPAGSGGDPEAPLLRVDLTVRGFRRSPA